jgi:hypothetical protein
MNIQHIKWKRILDIAAASLLVAGGLNWGLIGFFHVDLVAAICGGLDFGETNTISRLIYSLVGLAGGYAAYLAFSLKGLEQRWNIHRQEGPKIAA